MKKSWNDPDLPQNHWSLDKRIPIAVIVLLLGQSATAVWWARGIQSEQIRQAGVLVEEQRQRESLENSLSAFRAATDTRMQDLREDVSSLSSRVATVSATTAGVRQEMGTLRQDIRANNDLLRRILERMPRDTGLEDG